MRRMRTTSSTTCELSLTVFNPEDLPRMDMDMVMAMDTYIIPTVKRRSTIPNRR
jgi:hypothetical protein